jgi:hypothetical protein
VLTFSLEPGSPPWTTIDPDTGNLRLDVPDGLGGTRLPIQIRVSDNGTPPLSSSAALLLDILKRDRAPVITQIPPQQVTEGDHFEIPVQAFDPDDPGSPLKYKLETEASPELSIDSNTGYISWTPSESDGPALHQVIVFVTDFGARRMTAAMTFELRVLERNQRPEILQIPTVRIQEQRHWSLRLNAYDSDLPANQLTYLLDAPVPEGLVLDSETGLMVWTPPETAGPSTNTIRVRVVDDGVPPLLNTMTFPLEVTEHNRVPQLLLVPPQETPEGSQISVQLQASDPDLPANRLTYSLESGPTGAQLDPSSGVFRWTPQFPQSGVDFPVVVKVSDNGDPPLSAVTDFSIRVTSPLISLQLFRDPEGVAMLQISGATGRSCRILYSDDLQDWVELLQTNAPSDRFFIPLPDGGSGRSFYRVVTE